MPPLIDNIKQHLRKGDTLQRFIVVNVAVFVLINLSKVIFQLFQLDLGWYNSLIKWLSVPASLHALVLQPWSIVTYAFLHEGFFHILFNMLWLFWMGRILAEYLGNKKLVSTYFLGGIAGAVLYIIAFNLFPLFSSSLDYSRALGASASVLAITVAVATLLPDYTIMLMFIGPVKMKYIALFTIVLDLLSITGDNAGGHIAHLGGALYGFIYIKQLRAGNDIAAWFTKMTDFIEGIFKPKPRMKVVYKKEAAKKKPATRSTPDQETIDNILDKISRSGYGSLNAEEKELLFKASKNTND